MYANAVPLLSVFELKQHLEVPLFQRQYVWSEQHQWAPLWEDVSRKFTEYLDGRKEAPAHFLGAMVLDQKQVPTTHVPRRLIIDGQQRLTTLQIFLSALRDFCAANDCPKLAEECSKYILNTGMMTVPEVEKFKVWPTQRDQQQFGDVISSLSRAELMRRHPLKRRKYARKPEPRPRMIESYLYFYDQLADYFKGSDLEPPLHDDVALSLRLDECIQALKNGLRIVVIDLDKDDDAQVIFETLNARGEPLLPADLLRNYIFLRAARGGEKQDDLYKKFWNRFDDDFWRKEVSQGRHFRPRSDLFIQHYLASQVLREIPIKHLFVEYKYWIDEMKPFPTVSAELDKLAKQGDAFRRIMDPEPDDVLYPLGRFLNAFEIGTAHPLLLVLLEKGLPDVEWARISAMLESYILRRAICGLSNKNYNRVFLTVAGKLREATASADALETALAAYAGESTEWPTDRAFLAAWKDNNTYSNLAGGRTVHLLQRLNDALYTDKMESIAINGPLTVEHLLPQNWKQHWPLPDGQHGLDNLEIMLRTDLDEEIVVASERRQRMLQTVGNLTLMTQPLNASVSNGPWLQKREAIIDASLLPINIALRSLDAWDETAIAQRSNDLFELARIIWPAPKRA